MLWRLSNPFASSYAEAGIRGTWISISGLKGLCPECGLPSHDISSPIVIEWIPGTDQIGDFAWASTGIVLVQNRVLKALDRQFEGFRPEPVEMIETNEPLFDTPTKDQPRIKLPYEGPTLHYLNVTARAVLDFEKSTLETRSDCETCARRRYTAKGVEKVDHKWDRDKRELIKTLVPRIPGMGHFIRQSNLAGASLVEIDVFPGWIMCTDAVKTFIEEHGFPNVMFFEMGEIID